MIKYSLICDQDHNFEAWFSDSSTCESQLKKSKVECPLCGSKKITKSIMAPNIPSKSNQNSPKSDVKKVEIVMNKIKKHDTDVTLRYYGLGAQIIKEFNVRNMILFSRSKKKLIGLEGFGLKIQKQIIIK